MLADSLRLFYTHLDNSFLGVQVDRLYPMSRPGLVSQRDFIGTAGGLFP